MISRLLVILLLPCLFGLGGGEVANSFPVAKQGCSERCGSVSVPYPFGIGSLTCAKNESFLLYCNDTGLFYGNVRVHNISLENSTFTAGFTPAYECYNQTDFISGNVQISTRRINLQNSSFTISHTHNKLTALGCDTVGWMGNRRGRKFQSGCISLCDENTTSTDLRNITSCSGFGCCQTPIPENIKELNVWVSSYNNHSFVWNFNPCGYAFVSENDFDISTIDLAAITTDPTKLPHPPVVIEWATGDDQYNCQAGESPLEYSCSDNAECSYSKSKGESTCSCRQGYTGNPYLQQGCLDIDECSSEQRKQYPCHGTCKNKNGGYTCHCPLGMRGDGKVGCRGLALTTIAAVIGVVILFGIIIALILYVFQKRKKDKNFRENGGMILKHQRIVENQG